MTTTLSLCLLLCAAQGAAEEATHAPTRRALLVGCSTYPGADPAIIKPLPGAENDVAMMRELLQQRFSFRAGDIATLAGWPDDESLRPTHANICRALDALVAAAGADDQIVIYLSGHGKSLKLEDRDPEEPDGFDEAFVPADYATGGKLILDNQVKLWLDGLKTQRAHVWIIFDSCFSGTMSRGNATDGTVVSRGIIGGPTRAGARADVPDNALDIPARTMAEPGLIAFYAAQEFEEALELVRPIGADPKDPKNRHGLMSYHLQQLLQLPHERLTYGQLGRMLVGRFRADGKQRPTPYFQGHLDREVLGVAEWPRGKPLNLQRADGAVRLTAGTLSGVAEGTILAVYTADDRKQTAPLCHVRVTAATPTSAHVEPVAHGESPSLPLAEIPDAAACRIVGNEWNSRRLAVALTHFPLSEERLGEQLAAAVDPLWEAEAAIVVQATKVSDADWALYAVTAEVAKRYDLPAAEPLVLLLSSEDAQQLRDDAGGDAPIAVRAHYRLSEIERDAGSIAADWKKVFTYQNLWRVVSEYSAGSPLAENNAVDLHVQTSRGPFATQLRAGDTVEISVVNRDFKSYYYTLLFFNERFGIDVRETKTIDKRQGGDLPPTQQPVASFRVSDKWSGTNGFVVIAQAMKGSAEQPDYRFLVQSMLGGAIDRSAATVKPTTAMEALLHSAQSGGRLRNSISLENPQMAFWSWTTAAP